MKPRSGEKCITATMDKFGASGKTALLRALECGGEVALCVTERAEKATLDRFVHGHAYSSATWVLTDEHGGYSQLNRTYRRQVDRRSAGDYAKSVCQNNRMGGLWYLLKHEIGGIDYVILPIPINRYVSQVSWLFNLSNVQDFIGPKALLVGRDCEIIFYKSLAS